MKFQLFFLSFLSVTLLTGCGYRLSTPDSINTSFKTVSIPYIEGDLQGDLTKALIHKVAASGQWEYVRSEGELTLRVSLVKTRDEEVGYSYSDQNGQINKWLVPNENKLSSLVKVELIETKTQKVLLGPEFLSASVHYDYDPSFNIDNFVRFSLAQFNFQEIAARTAKIPLDERLANTVVEYLENAW